MLGLRDGRGRFNSLAGIRVDCTLWRGGGVRFNAEFFSCSFNYFNYAAGFEL